MLILSNFKNNLMPRPSPLEHMPRHIFVETHHPPYSHFGLSSASPKRLPFIPKGKIKYSCYMEMLVKKFDKIPEMQSTYGGKVYCDLWFQGLQSMVSCPYCFDRVAAQYIMEGANERGNLLTS
ncbi:rCG22708 [Rattus norvegicus]|uniref:RCG22708 n=1 Tax=Rattus norvegicus TaxID=10116 RepID=A6JYE5_RAT|nr:rCG22708 [Rattus norvegicus]